MGTNYGFTGVIDGYFKRTLAFRTINFKVFQFIHKIIETGKINRKFCHI